MLTRERGGGEEGGRGEGGVCEDADGVIASIQMPRPVLPSTPSVMSLSPSSPPTHTRPHAAAAPTTAGLSHVPSALLQVPGTWHWSRAVHVTGLVPVHTPLEQESVWVQALPSLQPVLSGCSKQNKFGLKRWQPGGGGRWVG